MQAREHVSGVQNRTKAKFWYKKILSVPSQADQQIKGLFCYVAKIKVCLLIFDPQSSMKSCDYQ